MRTLVLMALGGLTLAACGDPVSDETRARAAAERQARAECFEAAGFTVHENSPPPADGGNRTGPGGDAWNDGALQAPDGTWLDLYSWNEWRDDPEAAERIAAHQAELFTQVDDPDYGDARAVGRRAYVSRSQEPFPVNPALDACLMMP